MFRKINFEFIILSYTILIYFLYLNTNSLDFLTGKKYQFEEITYNFTCNNLEFYCRNISFEFYKFFFSIFTTNVNIIFFFQILLFSFSVCYLVNQLFKSKINNLIIKLLFFIVIFSNPKVFKYSFTLTEEAIFIPFLTLSTAFFIKSIEKYKFKNLFILSILIGVAYAIRPAGIFLFLMPSIIIIRYYKNINYKIIYILVFLLAPKTLDDFAFKKINLENKPSFIWGAMLGKLPLFVENLGSNDNKYYEFEILINDYNKKINDNLNNFNSHTLKQYHRNATIEIFKTSKVTGPINKIEDYFKAQKEHSNDIIKNTFFSSLRLNKYFFIREIFYNYIGIWQLREILTNKNKKTYNNFIKKNDLILAKKYNLIFNSTNHPDFIVKSSKIFMLFFMIINIYIIINFFRYLLFNKNNYRLNTTLYLLLIINFYFLIIALVTNVQTRLILAIWPIICTSILLSINSIYDDIKKIIFSNKN